MRRAATVAAVTAALLLPCPARAQDAGATSEARIEFAQGVEAFEAERFDEALRHFEHAWQLRPHPTVRVNLASCYAKLGRASSAVMHYRAYLADRSVQISRPARREIQNALALLEPRVGALDLQLVPPDARVTVDGAAPEARDGARVFTSAGTHRIEASAPGRGSQTRTVDVAGGSTQSLSIELAAGAAPPPTPMEPPPHQPPVEPPPEGVDDGGTDEGAPPIGGAIEATPEERPSSGGSGRIIARWSAFGLAGVAVAGAAVLGVLALGADSDFDAGAKRIEDHDYASEAERAQIDRQARDDADRAGNLALYTDICIGVAAAAAITGTVLLLTTPSAPPDDQGEEDAARSLHLAAGPTPTGFALQVGGSF